MLTGDFHQVMDLFCTKSADWSYEEEWRAFHKEAGTPFTYPLECLTGVYFGPEMNRASMEIIHLILGNQNETVKFWKGRRSPTEFKVLFEEQSYTTHLEAKQGSSARPRGRRFVAKATLRPRRSIRPPQTLHESGKLAPRAGGLRRRAGGCWGRPRDRHDRRPVMIWQCSGHYRTSSAGPAWATALGPARRARPRPRQRLPPRNGFLLYQKKRQSCRII